MADDPNASGSIPGGRPDPKHVPDGDRDLHHEGVPEDNEESKSKGGPPTDDRLGSETAHAETARKDQP